MQNIRNYFHFCPLWKQIHKNTAFDFTAWEKLIDSDFCLVHSILLTWFLAMKLRKYYVIIGDLSFKSTHFARQDGQESRQKFLKNIKNKQMEHIVKNLTQIKWWKKQSYQKWNEQDICTLFWRWDQIESTFWDLVPFIGSLNIQRLFHKNS